MDVLKKKNVLSKEELEEQLNILMTWVTEQVEKQDVPRFSDVLDYAYRVLKFKQLKRFQITKRLRLNKAYLMNSSQARKKMSSSIHRPIIVNNIGNLHGDIGFYPVVREYETPIEKRSGFLICVDILTRMKYVSDLKKTRTAESMIRSFKEIMEKFKIHHKGLHVKSLAFDKERSVMGHKFQSFLKEKKIVFHAFSNSSSKSKMAENGIRQIRNTIERMKGNTKSKEIRWWRLIQPAVNTLNKRPIEIKNKFLTLPFNTDHPYYTPLDVQPSNLKDFISKIQKAAPIHFFSQFSIDPRYVKFNYKIGDFVRPKLIVISSEVIGNKRSEKSLSNEVFIIEKLVPFVSTAYTIENAYLCKSIVTGEEETFSEDDLALTLNPFSNTIA